MRDTNLVWEISCDEITETEHSSGMHGGTRQMQTILYIYMLIWGEAMLLEDYQVRMRHVARHIRQAEKIRVETEKAVLPALKEDFRGEMHEHISVAGSSKASLDGVFAARQDN
jgi:hypothetical protein